MKSRLHHAQTTSTRSYNKFKTQKPIPWTLREFRLVVQVEGSEPSDDVGFVNRALSCRLTIVGVSLVPTPDTPNVKTQ